MVLTPTGQAHYSTEMTQSRLGEHDRGVPTRIILELSFYPPGWSFQELVMLGWAPMSPLACSLMVFWSGNSTSSCLFFQHSLGRHTVSSLGGRIHLKSCFPKHLNRIHLGCLILGIVTSTSLLEVSQSSQLPSYL